MIVLLAVFLAGEGGAHAQGRDSLLNGTLIGAAVGAGVGVAFTHVVRDTEGAGQYVYGALVFGAIGAGTGLGLDALLHRAWPGPAVTSRRVLIAPLFWRDAAGVAVKWKW
jgi:hypothetical protein